MELLNERKLIKYIIRWQLSTPILAIVLWLLSDLNVTFATIIANFIGALIFFPLDKIIFKKNTIAQFGKSMRGSVTTAAAVK